MMRVTDQLTAMVHRQLNLFSALLLLLLICPSVSGGAQSMDEDKVRSANNAFYNAFSNRDVQRMNELWSDSSTVTAIHPGGKEILFGKQAGKKHWTEVFSRFPRIEISMPDPQVHVGSRLAWVVGVEEFRARRADGKEITFTVLATNIFEKQGDDWHLVHHHASRVPEK